MQSDGKRRRKGKPSSAESVSIVINDLKYQLNYLEASLPPQAATSRFVDAKEFTKIDVGYYWAINLSADEYKESAQERCCYCDGELDSKCQLYRGKAFCSPCFIRKQEILACCGCHQVIEGRVIWALGRAWHPEHLVCAQCEEVLSGGSFYESKGRPLCLYHFRYEKQETCHKCHCLLPQSIIEFANKSYCVQHFTCEFCDAILNDGWKLYTVDLRPICKRCYRELPIHFQRSLQKWRRRDRRPINLWLRNFIDRLLCIYPRSRYQIKRIPMNREALPYLQSGMVYHKPKKPPRIKISLAPPELAER